MYLLNLDLGTELVMDKWWNIFWFYLPYVLYNFFVGGHDNNLFSVQSSVFYAASLELEPNMEKQFLRSSNLEKI